MTREPNHPNHTRHTFTHTFTHCLPKDAVAVSSPVMSVELRVCQITTKNMSEKEFTAISFILISSSFRHNGDKDSYSLTHKPLSVASFTFLHSVCDE